MSSETETFDSTEWYKDYVSHSSEQSSQSDNIEQTKEFAQYCIKTEDEESDDLILLISEEEQAVCSYREETKKLLYFLVGLESESESSFITALEQYRDMLESQVELLSEEHLKEALIRDLIFLSLNFKRIVLAYTEKYLDIMEEILVFFTDVIKNYFKKIKNLKHLDSKMQIIRRESRKIKILLKDCLLNRYDRIMHVLMKLKVCSEKPISELFIDIYWYFLRRVFTYDHHEDILRGFILCYKFKEIVTEKEVDKIIYMVFQKSKMELKRVPVLCDIIIKLEDPLYSFRDMCVTYSRYYKRGRGDDNNRSVTRTSVIVASSWKPAVQMPRTLYSNPRSLQISFDQILAERKPGEKRCYNGNSGSSCDDDLFKGEIVKRDPNKEIFKREPTSKMAVIKVDDDSDDDDVVCIQKEEQLITIDSDIESDSEETDKKKSSKGDADVVFVSNDDSEENSTSKPNKSLDKLPLSVNVSGEPKSKEQSEIINTPIEHTCDCQRNKLLAQANKAPETNSSSKMSEVIAQPMDISSNSELKQPKEIDKPQQSTSSTQTLEEITRPKEVLNEPKLTEASAQSTCPDEAMEVSDDPKPSQLLEEINECEKATGVSSAEEVTNKEIVVTHEPQLNQLHEEANKSEETNFQSDKSVQLPHSSDEVCQPGKIIASVQLPEVGNDSMEVSQSSEPEMSNSDKTTCLPKIPEGVVKPLELPGVSEEIHQPEFKVTETDSQAMELCDDSITTSLPEQINKLKLINSSSKLPEESKESTETSVDLVTKQALDKCDNNFSPSPEERKESTEISDDLEGPKTISKKCLPLPQLILLDLPPHIKLASLSPSAKATVELANNHAISKETNNNNRINHNIVTENKPAESEVASTVNDNQETADSAIQVSVPEVQEDVESVTDNIEEANIDEEELSLNEDSPQLKIVDDESNTDESETAISQPTRPPKEDFGQEEFEVFWDEYRRKYKTGLHQEQLNDTDIPSNLDDSSTEIRLEQKLDCPPSKTNIPSNSDNSSTEISLAQKLVSDVSSRTPTPSKTVNSPVQLRPEQNGSNGSAYDLPSEKLAVYYQGFGSSLPIEYSDGQLVTYPQNAAGSPLNKIVNSIINRKKAIEEAVATQPADETLVPTNFQLGMTESANLPLSLTMSPLRVDEPIGLSMQQQRISNNFLPETKKDNVYRNEFASNDRPLTSNVYDNLEPVNLQLPSVPNRSVKPTASKTTKKSSRTVKRRKTFTDDNNLQRTSDASSYYQDSWKNKASVSARPIEYPQRTEETVPHHNELYHCSMEGPVQKPVAQGKSSSDTWLWANDQIADDELRCGAEPFREFESDAYQTNRMDYPNVLPSSLKTANVKTGSAAKTVTFSGLDESPPDEIWNFCMQDKQYDYLNYNYNNYDNLYKQANSLQPNLSSIYNHNLPFTGNAPFYYEPPSQNQNKIFLAQQESVDINPNLLHRETNSKIEDFSSITKALGEVDAVLDPSSVFVGHNTEDMTLNSAVPNVYDDRLLLNSSNLASETNNPYFSPAISHVLDTKTAVIEPTSMVGLDRPNASMYSTPVTTTESSCAYYQNAVPGVVQMNQSGLQQNEKSCVATSAASKVSKVEENVLLETQLPPKKRNVKEFTICYPAQRQMSIADLHEDFPKIKTMAARKLYPDLGVEQSPYFYPENHKQYNDYNKSSVTNVYINGLRECSANYPLCLMIGAMPTKANQADAENGQQVEQQQQYSETVPSADINAHQAPIVDESDRTVLPGMPNLSTLVENKLKRNRKGTGVGTDGAPPVKRGRGRPRKNPI